MEIKDCFFLGKIIKKFGYKGEMVAKLDTDCPESYDKLEAIFLLIGGKLLPFVISESSLNGEFLRFKLKGINSEQEVERLLRSDIYLPVTMLAELDDDEYYYHEIIGFKLEDKILGYIGEVTNINTTTSQNLLEVDFKGKSILIPLVDAFILNVNKRNKTITSLLPDGLLDIYLSDSDKQEDI